MREFRSTHRAELAESGKAWRQRNSDRVRNNKRLWAEKNREHRTQQIRKWRQSNHDHVRAYDKAWKSQGDNRERLAASAAQRRRTPKAREAQRARSLRWYEANKGRAADHARKWHQVNYDKVRVHRATRRAAIQKADKGDRRAYLIVVRRARTAQTIPCYWCKARTTLPDRVLDHIIPLAKGGPDSAGNLCISCRHCNAKKHAKMPEEFTGQSELRFA